MVTQRNWITIDKLPRFRVLKFFILVSGHRHTHMGFLSLSIFQIARLKIFLTSCVIGLIIPRVSHFQCMVLYVGATLLLLCLSLPWTCRHHGDLSCCESTWILSTVHNHYMLNSNLGFEFWINNKERTS